MDKTELISIIQAARENSLGVNDGSLSVERANALDHYHGRPYGNEQEGLSQVVSKDLSETIDWLMPNIMDVMLKSGNLVEFPPMGPDDEEQAAQATDYVDFVIMQDNEGFMLLHDACKDALLLKNGYVKHYWEEKEKIREEEYEDLTLEQLLLMEQEATQKGIEVEILGQEEKQVMTPAGVVPVFDLKVRYKEKVGKCCIEATPPEEIRVSKNCRGTLRNADFVEHVTTKTRSDLIEMGMNRDFVDTLPAYEEVESQVSYSRNSVDEESNPTNNTNRSMDKIEYCEAYLKVDWDKDGIAELRKVVTVANKIPDGEEWNEPIDFVPFTSFVAKRVPHRHVGESLDDELAELQEIKTTLLRQLLNNIYNTNHNQWLVNERVNLSDFMESLPGGIKRITGLEPISNACEPVVVAPIINQILPAIDYVDNLKANRTGVNPASMGVDPNFLQETTKGAYMENANRAAKKVEMYIRMLGECAKEMCHNVYAIVTKYQDKPRITKLRGKYVEVDPRSWRERQNAKVNVGLGTGTEDDKRQRYMMLLQLQEGLKQYGLVGPQQVYQTAIDTAKTLGFDNPEKYALTPGSPEHQQAMQQQAQQAQQQMQAESSVLANAEQVKGQFVIEKAKMDMQVKQLQDQYKNELNAMKMQYEATDAERERKFKAMESHLDRVSKEAIEAAKLELQALIAGLNVDFGVAGQGTMPESQNAG